MQKETAKLCEALCAVTGISVRPIFPDFPKQFCCESCDTCFCTYCPYRLESEWSTHLYGLNEAYRHGGHFIYHCPKSLLFVAVSVSDRTGKLIGGMIAGPIIADNMQDLSCFAEYPSAQEAARKIPVKTTAQVCQLSHVMWAAAHSIHGDSFRQPLLHGPQEADHVEADVYDQSESERERYDYILYAENRLSELIRARDKDGSRELLACLLERIFCHTEHLSEIKARTLELIAFISRITVSDGIGVVDGFRHSAVCMQRISSCTSAEQLQKCLCNILDRYLAASFDNADIRHSDVIYRAMEYIRANCLQRITLDDVAGAVFLSKSYLSSIFKQETGMSITDYINQSRVTHSKKLLANNSLSLSDVAVACCFGDQSYFTRVFKRYEGIPPKQYRLNIAKRI